MSWQYSPLSLILVIAALLLGSFSLFAWKRRRTPGIVPVLILFIAATVWLAASAVSLANTDLAMAISMDALAYPAIVTIPVAYLLFALWYTEQDYRPSNLFISLLFVVPVLTVCLVATNDLHHLYYTGFSVVEGPRNSLIWTFTQGPLFWINASYSFVLILAAFILFIIRYRTVGTLFRTQISLVLAAGIIPLIASFLYYFELDPEAGFDWTPVTFVVSGFLLIIATLNFRLFSLQPLTNSLAVKTMKDGVVATNASGRITLINPAGSALLGLTEDEGVGRELVDIAPDLKRFLLSGETTGITGTTGNEIALPRGDSFCIYEVRNVVIPSEGEYEGGHLLTFRDVTERKQAETAFQKANHKLNLLSGIIRHDVKNKLTALFINLELATGSTEEQDMRRSLAGVHESAEGIRILIDFTQEYQDLGVAAPSWQHVGEALAGAGQHLDCSGFRVVDETGDLEILADRLFQRVIYNFLDNAIRYARGMTTFTLRYTRNGSNLILYAEDDGPGVSPEFKERIFERGFGHNTGLGLFLVRDILGITGITIRETGEWEKGARFAMTVPQGAYRFNGPGKES